MTDKHTPGPWRVDNPGFAKPYTQPFRNRGY